MQDVTTLKYVRHWNCYCGGGGDSIFDMVKGFTRHTFCVQLWLWSSCVSSHHPKISVFGR